MQDALLSASGMETDLPGAQKGQGFDCLALLHVKWMGHAIQTNHARRRLLRKPEMLWLGWWVGR
jgi:hypothetical protein